MFDNKLIIETAHSDLLPVSKAQATIEGLLV